jgi:hypothetical protein
MAASQTSRVGRQSPLDVWAPKRTRARARRLLLDHPRADAAMKRTRARDD